MRILIVEDEETLAGYLKKGLEESSYAVNLALNGTDGLHLATHETYVQNHRELKSNLLILISALIILSIVGGRFLARKSLFPIAHITETT
jgi:DNA-binding response OmpR family regulator